MKKLSKLMCLLLAVGMLMGIASCSSDAGEGRRLLRRYGNRAHQLRAPERLSERPV